jgi:hypothetical protein
MKRRSFTTWLGSASLPLAACKGRVDDAQTPARRPALDRNQLLVKPFSTSRFHASLEQLREAFESRQLPVTATLLPPLDEAELRRRCEWFPHPLPAELVSLYGWRAGQAYDAHSEKFPFCFRDRNFIGIDQAREEYRSMMSTYGRIPDPQIELAACFPFAAYSGSWYVFPCRGQHLDARLDAPIISVFQGIDIHFYSIEQMVETAFDWVRQSQHPDSQGTAPGDEMKAWREHNPGIFEPR